MEKLSDKNFNAVQVGKMSDLSNYVLQLAPGVEIKGKVFLGEELQLTGSNISFQSFPIGGESGFYHTHKSHEEIYIFLSGHGEFQVDNKSFTVEEGSVVRVSPEGKRSVRNTGETPLVMCCLQYKSNSFTDEDSRDGVILNDPVKW